MQQANGLSVSFNGHSSDQTLRRNFQHLDSHLEIESSLAAFFNDCQVIRFSHSNGVYTYDVPHEQQSESQEEVAAH
ncbi:hypothetical protein FGO68_gene2199 [Halteria grandinella]|uniref:Uncharacterized protein n=1 Tax=Halteria grandinella TaxID=5974 RepID=A0A8J8SUI9_HALGN|nr:hypothetical protein FGO68_gene2199 [Halteria grandinella]